MQAANDEERFVGQRTWRPKGQGLAQAPHLHVYIQIYLNAGKLHMKPRSPRLTWIPTVYQLTAKTITGNGIFNRK